MRGVTKHSIQILLGIFLIIGMSGCLPTQEELQVLPQDDNSSQIIINETQENISSKEDENLTRTEQDTLQEQEAQMATLAMQEVQMEEVAIEEAKKAEEDAQEKIRAKIAKEMKKNVYLDKAQKLMWQDNSAVTEVKKTWISAENYEAKEYSNTSGDTAATYCKKLTLVGYSDWRLPTKEELKNLYTQKESLKNVSANWYWSSSSSTSALERAWGIYFNNGDGYSDLKNTSNYVRCVRESKYLK